jgi:hypothetical protein
MVDLLQLSQDSYMFMARKVAKGIDKFTHGQVAKPLECFGLVAMLMLLQP